MDEEQEQDLQISSNELSKYPKSPPFTFLSSLDGEKAEEISELWHRQKKMAQQLVSPHEMKQLPEWAVSQDVEGQKQICEEVIEVEADDYQKQFEDTDTKYKSLFRDRERYIERTQKNKRTSSPTISFCDERDHILRQKHRIEQEGKRIKKAIETFGQEWEKK